MSKYCDVCGPELLHEDSETICRPHIVMLVPYVPDGPTAGTTPPNESRPDEGRGGTSASADGGQVPWSRSTCWNCGTASPAGNSECLNPDCRRSLTPPALVIRFSAGQVEVEPGARVDLGRLGQYARLFRAHLNVSRRHAAVGVDADGCAWVEPCVTPNGTFIDDAELDSSVRRPLCTDQRLRFARNVEGAVTRYAREDRP